MATARRSGGASSRRTTASTASLPTMSRCRSSTCARCARGLIDPPRLARLPRGGCRSRGRQVARRPVDVGEGRGLVSCPVYDRARLLAGHRIAGPAVDRAVRRDHARAPGPGGDRRRSRLPGDPGWRGGRRGSHHARGDRVGAAHHRRGDGRGAHQVAPTPPTSRSASDCSTAIFDAARARSSPRPSTSPMHLGSLLGSCAEILARYPVDELAPGDMFIANDPYMGGGTHLPDINVVSAGVRRRRACSASWPTSPITPIAAPTRDPQHLGRGPAHPAHAADRARAPARGRDGAAAPQLRAARRSGAATSARRSRPTGSASAGSSS